MQPLLRRWHRRVGLLVLLFGVLLSVTGIMLNHTEALGLDEVYVTSPPILGWYDIGPDSAPASYRVGDNHITRLGERLYFNSIELNEPGARLYGAVEQDGLIIAALEDGLLLLTRDGAVVENLGTAQGLPPGLEAIGIGADGGLVIRASGVGYRVDVNGLEWQPVRMNEVRWSVSEPLPEGLRTALLQQYRGRGLSLERLLLDLHSGRFLGGLGIYLMDLVAVLLVVLALSGAWVWLLQRR